MSSRGFADFLAQGLISLIVLYVLAVLWVIVQLFALIVRVMLKYPTNRLLWIGAVVVGLALLAAGLTDFRSQPVLTGFWVSFLGQAGLCKGVEMYYDQMLLRGRSRADLARAIAEEPWWSI